MPILAAEEARLVAAAAKVGRNDPCPCGGGLKAKRCHGLLGEPRVIGTRSEVIE